MDKTKPAFFRIDTQSLFAFKGLCQQNNMTYSEALRNYVLSSLAQNTLTPNDFSLTTLDKPLGSQQLDGEIRELKKQLSSLTARVRQIESNNNGLDLQLVANNPNTTLDTVLESELDRSENNKLDALSNSEIRQNNQLNEPLEKKLDTISNLKLDDKQTKSPILVETELSSSSPPDLMIAKTPIQAASRTTETIITGNVTSETTVVDEPVRTNSSPIVEEAANQLDNQEAEPLFLPTPELKDTMTQAEMAKFLGVKGYNVSRWVAAEKWEKFPYSHYWNSKKGKNGLFVKKTVV